MRMLNTYVHLVVDGDPRVFGPSDVVPDDVAELITNPDVWVTGTELDDEDESDRPPLTGKGSGKGAWTDYAESLGIEVPEDASRDDIVALVDALED